MRLVKNSWLFALSLAVLFCPGLLKSSAQTPQPTSLGSIEGVVLNQQVTPIAGADVYALPQGDMRHPAASTTTDSTGKFILQGLLRGGFYVYAYKESDGYPDAFFAFFTTPNGQYQIPVKVEEGQAITGMTMKLGAKFAHLKVHITDENGTPLNGGLTFKREDQPGDYGMGANADVSMLVPPVPFRLTVNSDGYEPWHYGGANWQGKAGLIALKSDQTLSLDVRLRKK